MMFTKKYYQIPIIHDGKNSLKKPPDTLPISRCRPLEPYESWYTDGDVAGFEASEHSYRESVGVFAFSFSFRELHKLAGDDET